MTTVKISRQALELYIEGRRPEAIRMIRQEYKLGLRDAIRYLDEILDNGVGLELEELSREELDKWALGLCCQGNKVQAIKVIRRGLHIGLKDGINYVDRLEADQAAAS